MKSASRVAVRYLNSSKETFVTSEGREFRMETAAFSRFLVQQGVKPGFESGSYLQGIQNIPEAWALSAQRAGAVFKRPPRDPLAIPPETGLDMQRAWDMFVKAVYAQFKNATDVKDLYANLPVDEDINNQIQTVSADMASNFMYAMEGSAKKWWDKMVDALRTGNYKNDFQRWDLRTLREQASDVVSEAWADAAQREWEKIEKNPRELARLDALRPTSRW